MSNVVALALNLLLVVLLLQAGSYGVLLSHRKSTSWLWGGVFGLVTVINMMTSVQVVPGWFIDFRNVSMLLGGFTGGTATAVIAAVCGALYRLYLGGSGAVTGVAALFTYGFLGVMLKRRWSFVEMRRTELLLGLGVLLASITLLFIIGGSYLFDQRVTIPSSLMPTIYILTSVGTLVSFKMFFALRDRLLEFATLDVAAQAIPTALVVKGKQGEVVLNTRPKVILSEMSEAQGRFERILQDRHYLVGVSLFERELGAAAALATLDDITLLKGALLQLENFFALSADAMLIMDGDNRILDANGALSDMLGFSTEEIRGVSLVEIFHPEDISATLASIRKTREAPWGHRLLENRLVRSDGTVRWLSWSLVGSPSEPLVYAVVRDVTEDKGYEQELRTQTEVLREQAEFLALAHDAVVVRDMSGLINYWNQGAERLYGYSREEAIGSPYHTLLPATYPLPLADIESDLLLHGDWSGEVKRQRRDDVSIILWSQWVVKKDREGCLEAILEVSRDITARKQAELDQAHLAALVQQSGDAIVTTNLDGRVLTWNLAAAKIFAYTAQDMENREFTDLVPQNDRTLWQALFERVRMGAAAGALEAKLLHASGGVVPVSVNISSIRNVFGRSSAFSLIIRDLTTKQKLDKEIARLDRLSLASQLAAGIGHEVRNPMTTVRGYLQFFGMRPDLAPFFSQFKLIISELDRINDILTEFLTLARNRPIELRPTALDGVIAASLPLLRSDAELVGCDIRLQLSGVPAIDASEKEIRQLLMNLVRNALEASTPGGVVIIRTEQSEGRVVLSVSDQGQGIPEEIRGDIGTPFFTTKQQGTGMGLTVCYAIAEQHRAEISFRTSSEGTTFLVSFPQALVAV